ncbi:MAG: leucine--tRNA ligase [Thermodesulfobacteriota bacterium]|nr:leucine--tRNA ligase [Thermodesulfobacteriota bacterium]
METKYDPKQIELKWQDIWQERQLFQVREDPDKEKYYLLEMFPYPSGNIHMGHVRNYTIGDVVARYKRMKGCNVLHPMGWDAFGMPAENAAIAHSVHPAKWTYENIETMKSQLKRLGFSYDWDRELATCQPQYYHWEQWLFVKMLERGMVYRKRSSVNWCQDCQTVLANEQVEAGLCWRCGNVVVQKELDQWFFRITDYADDLLEYCDNLPGWPDKVVTMQKNWIGKSVGAEIYFPLEKSGDHISVFTTRQDTVYGATFMCMAPEHPMVLKLSAGTPQEAEVRAFVERMARQDKAKRTSEDYEKEGVFIGTYCINPFTKRRMPIFTANFALMEYGTGAVMAVPAHDQRDFEFARKYDLEIVVVIQPEGATLDPETMTEAYVGEGLLVRSPPFDGLKNVKALDAIADYLQDKELGKRAINFRLRDWGISRQRYWGAPIPVVYCETCGVVPVPEKDLPVVLPEETHMLEGGRSPLPTLESFLTTQCPRCGNARARRETDTMDTFVESSWYFERYCSPRHVEGMFDKEAVRYWMPVDQYIGGVEHAILHLLYSRYFTRVLKDFGLVDYKEPFTRLLTQGMVCKETKKCPDHGFLYPEEVVQREGRPTCKHCGRPVEVGRIEKMSKSKKNVVDPNLLMEKYGADTLRLFCLFAAPPERDLDWSDQGVEGAYRFLNKVWRLVSDHVEVLKGIEPYDGGQELDGESKDLYRKTHQTIKRVTTDIDTRFHFNTAISAVMELVNTIQALRVDLCSDATGCAVLRFSLETTVVLLSPLVPHFADELWEALGHTGSVLEVFWPTYRQEAIEEDQILIVVQVNGKVRSRFQVSADTDEERIKAAALADERVVARLAGRPVKKLIVVQNKLVNIVV